MSRHEESSIVDTTSLDNSRADTDATLWTPDTLQLDDHDDDMPDVLRKCSKPNELPHYVTNKFFIPDEMSECAARHALHVHRDLLEEVTTNKEKNIFRGVLVRRGNDEKGGVIGDEEGVLIGSDNCVKSDEQAESRRGKEEYVVVSKRRKGAASSNIGTQSPSGFTFLPEEALLQVELGILEVFTDDKCRVPLPLKSLYEILLPEISVELYQTYAHLVKIGYIVRRRRGGRVLDVRKPKSRDTDFSVVVLGDSHVFPSLPEIVGIIGEVGTTCVKVAKVTSGCVYFYTLGLVDFPHASEIS